MAWSAALLLSSLIWSVFLTEQEILDTTFYENDYGLVSLPVDSFPQSLLPEGASGLDLIPVRSADATELLAAARITGGWIVLDTLVSMGQFNDAKAWAWWDGEKQQLVLASQMPFRMFTFFTVWRPVEQGFELVEEYQEDPSEQALCATQALLDSGLVEEATNRLYDVFYPQWYYSGEEMAAGFLRASWREAQRRAGQGDWDGALAVYMCAGPAYEQCGLTDEWFLDYESLRDDGNPVGLWMHDDELAEVLDHLAAVAAGAGNADILDRAEQASKVLQR